MSLMSSGPAGNDRDTATHDRNAAVRLDEALNAIRLEGAIFLKADYTERWAYESLPGDVTAQVLHGTDRIVLFHVIASGRCWVSVDGGEKHWANKGDVIVLPYGDQHTVGGVHDADVVSISTLLDPPPWEQMPYVHHGEGGSLTEMICGYLYTTDPLFDPRLRALPPVFVVRPPEGPARDWVRANVDYALSQASVTDAGRPVLATRLPEMLFIEVMRLHLATAPAVDVGWIAALHDPVLAPALSALHERPAHRWTVSELAAAASVSRSGLDARFREVLQVSPIRYLADWRMHLARDLLASTDLPVAAVARRVGYDAEEAFSRAFKRAYGESPAIWRVHRTH